MWVPHNVGPMWVPHPYETFNKTFGKIFGVSSITLLFFNPQHKIEDLICFTNHNNFGESLGESFYLNNDICTGKK